MKQAAGGESRTNGPLVPDKVVGATTVQCLQSPQRNNGTIHRIQGRPYSMAPMSNFKRDGDICWVATAPFWLVGQHQRVQPEKTCSGPTKEQQKNNPGQRLLVPGMLILARPRNTNAAIKVFNGNPYKKDKATGQLNMVNSRVCLQGCRAQSLYRNGFKQKVQLAQIVF